MSKTSSINGVNTFINPAGVVEQHYIGRVTSATILKAMEDLRNILKQEPANNKPTLFLSDLSMVTSHTLPSHKTAIQNMDSRRFLKSAVYGSLSMQILLNTLFMVAGKHEHSRAFSNRVEALEWLKKSTDSVEK